MKVAVAVFLLLAAAAVHAQQDCVTTGWSDWSECKDCQQSRTREPIDGNHTTECTLVSYRPCDDGSGRCGPCGCGVNAYCLEHGDCLCNTGWTMDANQTCTVKLPPRDCEYSPWSDWSTCDVLCGGGQQQRTRSILRIELNNGTACDRDTLISSRNCSTAACPTCNGVQCTAQTDSCDEEAPHGCLCAGGWTGDDCSVPPPTCYEGYCNSNHSSGCMNDRCVCLDGWLGDQCQLAPSCPNSCSGHGICEQRGDSVHCLCWRVGSGTYIGDDCSQFVTDAEAVEEPLREGVSFAGEVILAIFATIIVCLAVWWYRDHTRERRAASFRPFSDDAADSFADPGPPPGPAPIDLEMAPYSDDGKLADEEEAEEAEADDAASSSKLEEPPKAVEKEVVEEEAAKSDDSVPLKEVAVTDAVEASEEAAPVTEEAAAVEEAAAAPAVSEEAEAPERKKKKRKKKKKKKKGGK
eukprot:PLAT5293.1.p1 GENE.PLAT5293.1~~PLAT5293.1.p1  ORF type:complete len:465 (-),score=242.39 PLAT5293.1:114-1508(-)